MVRVIPLRESSPVTLNAQGTGTVRMRPDGPQETWLPDSVSAKVTGATGKPQATCRVYVGAAATDPYFVDATGSGSFGDATGMVSGHRIGRHSDPYLFGVWTGGEPGATATLTVTGTKEVP